jgi:ParB-like chromosome segregation protein Spo0J
MELKNHPAADAFPMMDPQRFAELKSDIEKNGQREPVTLCDGMVLDGRNRYKACIELGLKPRTKNYDGDPWSFAWSLNGARRDLDGLVRSLVYLRCVEGSKEWKKRLEKIAEEGNRKKSEAAKGMPYAPKGSSRKTEKVVDHCDPPPSKKHVAREARAAEAKVSPATMGRAMQLHANKELADKVISGKVKGADAIRQIREEKKLQDLKDKAQKKSDESISPGSSNWSVWDMDVIDGLIKVEKQHQKPSLVFADPPYNIGIDYGQGKEKDSMSVDSYLAWCKRWIGLCFRCLTDNGCFWLVINDEYAAELCILAKESGFVLRSWVKWYETFGVNCKDKFNRTSRHVFYFIKDQSDFVFNAQHVTRPSDRQEKYADARASKNGKIWDDVWQIPRLT